MLLTYPFQRVKILTVDRDDLGGGDMILAQMVCDLCEKPFKSTEAPNLTILGEHIARYSSPHKCPNCEKLWSRWSQIRETITSEYEKQKQRHINDERKRFFAVGGDSREAAADAGGEQEEAAGRKEEGERRKPRRGRPPKRTNANTAR
jgi:hypothetical protein